jgi:hypothetical protein
MAHRTPRTTAAQPGITDNPNHPSTLCISTEFDLIKRSGLGAAIRRHVGAAGDQGWLDLQMVQAVIFLNLSGGDCVDDIERLECDRGFAAILRATLAARLFPFVPVRWLMRGL